MSKNIVFCADGTWNNPDDDDVIQLKPDPSSNVFKLFTLLSGRMVSKTKVEDATGEIIEREKKLATGDTQQIAKYINGVGNAQNKIQQLIGGGFGPGLIARIVRGYTFISRNYTPGDSIHIIGFSRGAYTARALAGLIVSQGLLSNKFARGEAESYKLGAQAWYRYRKAGAADQRNVFGQLTAAVQDLPSFIKSNALKDSDLIKNIEIATVAVWDTVGTLGVPEYNARNNALEDAFRFADMQLSKKVGHGFHALALDEQRLMFSPTFWEKAPNVTQLVFPGAHSDVGGGYPTTNKESGLSDGGLQWMIEQLSTRGVLFTDAIKAIKPDATAPAHKEWKNVAVTGLGLRKFNTSYGVVAHQSLLDRKQASAVVNDIGAAPGRYNPLNWLD